MDDSLILFALGFILIVLGLFVKTYFACSKGSSPSEKPVPVLTQKKLSPLKKPKSQYIGEILIFFGSQSGTAAKYSNILAEEAETNDFEAKVVDLEEYESHKFKEKLCVFLMATYGEGDPTDNAKAFYKWLKSEAMDKETLKGLKFVVFGLGNSQYQHYNAMGRNVNKLLEDLGGERVYKYGEGDDNSSLEDDFMAWKEGIWSSLKEKILNKDEKKEQEIKPKKIEKKENLFSIVETNEPEIDFTSFDYKTDGKEYEYQTKKFLESTRASVSFVKEARQNLKDGSTLHIEIDIKETTIKYITAQNLAIFPQNTPEKVKELADMLDFNLDQIVKVEYNGSTNKKFKYPFPSPISIRNILTHFCDFQGPIMKKTLKELTQTSISVDLKSKLALLSSNEGKLDFKKEIEEPKHNLFNLIKQYSIKLNLFEFISLTPRIAPRLFTIASSNLKYPYTLHVTASLLEEHLNNGSIKKGLISQYFEQLQKDFQNGLQQKALIFFNESQFKLPNDHKIPLIMIGPGTGVAPFRSFLQEKEFLMKEKNLEKGDMEMILYSGCKHEDGDYIYKEEFKEYLESGVLQKYYMAFSRDQENKIYVQNLIKKNQDEVYELIKKRQATLYLCGSTKMGKDVIEILEEIIMENEKLSKEEARNVLNKMETENKLIKELWG